MSNNVSFLRRSFVRAGAGGVALLIGSLASGCGSAGPLVEGEELDALSQSLSASGWRKWSSPPADTDGYTDSPGICPVHARSGFGASGVMLLGRSAKTNKFRLTIYEKLRPWREWTDIKDSPTFNSKPVCSSLDELNLAPVENWNNQLAIVGKLSSTNANTKDRFQIQVMKLKTSAFDPDNNPATNPPPPSVPTVVKGWTAISSDVYASAPGSAVLGGNLVVVGRRSDNRIYVHVNPLNTASVSTPYDATKWEAAVKTAALPTGWTAIGSPSVTHIGAAIGEGIIATRAKNARNVVRIYTYYMYVPWRTVGGFKLSEGTWSQLPTGSVVVDSDVALEFETRIVDQYRTTAYFRSTDNRIYQATGDGFNWDTFTLVDSVGDTTDDYTDFENAPAALGSSEVEGGHLVTARRSDKNVYWAGLIPGWGY